MNRTSWTDVQEALNDLDFPATKEEIVQHADHARGRSEDAIRLLRALPLATYRNISEIRSSVRLDPAEDDGRTAADKARQVRSTHRQVAEHLRTD